MSPPARTSWIAGCSGNPVEGAANGWPAQTEKFFKIVVDNFVSVGRIPASSLRTSAALFNNLAK